MRILKLSIFALTAIAIFTTAQFAEKNPNYGCAKVGRDCVAKCDKGAEKSKNAKAYDKCLADCDKAESNCNKRQEKAGDCAESFRSCNQNAKTEKDKEACRASYRKCKGE